MLVASGHCGWTDSPAAVAVRVGFVEVILVIFSADGTTSRRIWQGFDVKIFDLFLGNRREIDKVILASLF